MITHESIVYWLLVHTMLKFFFSLSLAAAIRPLYASVIATSPDASSCGGCEPFSHHTRFAFSLSSVLNARSTPAGVASVLYTSAGATPSAISAISRVVFGPLRSARLPGYFWTFQKSAQDFGGSVLILSPS